MHSEKDLLSRALGRLGRVPPGVLDATRERIRRNLKTGHRSMAPLPPPDATRANLTALRRPFYIAGAMATVCILIAIGAVLQWRPGVRPTSTPAPKSTSRQTSESQPSAPPLRSSVEAPPSVTPAPVKPKRAPRPKADTQPAESPPVQASRLDARFPLLPPGDGRVILDRACGACHRAAAVGNYHFATRAEYDELVSRMIAMGAPVSEQEAVVLIDYLYDNFGTKPERELDTAGRAILQRACTVCHSLNGIENYSYDSEGPYEELISTMVSYGAKLSEAEKTTLIRYLFATYGKR
jgi:mono/diheme cytochrome c family protein